MPLALTIAQIEELKEDRREWRLRAQFKRRLAELLQGHADPGDGNIWRAAQSGPLERS